MTQKDLILKWNEEHVTPTNIHNKLKELFGDKALSLSTVSYTIRSLSWNATKPGTQFQVGKPPNLRIDQLILKCLDEDPTLSCHEIAQRIRANYSSVRYVLINRLNYKCYNLKWLPHFLNDSMKKNRVTYSQQLLDILLKCQKNDFKFILTGDESWFFYYSPHCCQWVHEDEEVPRMVKGNFLVPKRMITIFWNTNGIALLHVLPQNSHMNSTIFIEDILTPLTKFPAYVDAKSSRKKFYLHFDNARAHKAKCVDDFLAQKKFTIPVNPAYSPDLAPSDFYLFGKLKNKFKGVIFESPDELESSIRYEFERIPKSELMSVFNGWIERLQRCIQIEGDYI